ncbi:MAG: hypothetical protein KatS3mg114_1374 [Planctomycetaceae bacterium]|nr:MAG: hypothetical protein KatS3mg114_1374 [Planctomycetaceae bacterium]
MSTLPHPQPTLSNYADRLILHLIQVNPGLAARCLLSELEPDQALLDCLRQRVRNIDYCHAPDDELAGCLEAILVLGDGLLLVEHLRGRVPARRLRGFTKELSAVYPATREALKGIVRALEEPNLQEKKWRYFRNLLVPLKNKQLTVPQDLLERVHKLWQHGRNKKAPDYVLVDLIEAFALHRYAPPALKADVHNLTLNIVRRPVTKRNLRLTCRCLKLLWEGWLQDTYLAATPKPPQETFFDAVNRVITALLERFVYDAYQLLQQIGVDPQPFQAQAVSSVRRLLAQRRASEALGVIQAFQLDPKPFVRDLLTSQRITHAWRIIKTFQIEPQLFLSEAQRVVRALLSSVDRSSRHAKKACQVVETFQLDPQAFQREAECADRELTRQGEFNMAAEVRRVFRLPPAGG